MKSDIKEDVTTGEERQRKRLRNKESTPTRDPRKEPRETKSKCDKTSLDWVTDTVVVDISKRVCKP